MPVYNEPNKEKWTNDGRHWYFRIYYRDINDNLKQKKSKMYFTKQQAMENELLFLSKHDIKILVKFTTAANSYFENISKIRKVSTVYSYKKAYFSHIEPFFKDMYINDVSIKKISLWADNMNSSDLSTEYKNKIYVILSNIMDHAIREYGIKSNLVKAYGRFQEKNDKVIPDDKKIRYITYDEFVKFIGVIDDPLWKTFFTFAYYSGCRRGEIQSLKWTDIDFTNNDILIDKTLYEEVKGNVEITSTKNNQNRKIKMSKTLRNTLLDYKNIVMTYKDFSDNWFVFGNTRFLPKTTIDRNKDKYFKISGVHRITMHEFRHSHVSLLINEYVKSSKEKNMKVDTAKFFLMMSNRLGHTIQVMQDTYMHLFPTIQDEIVDLLDNL